MATNDRSNASRSFGWINRELIAFGKLQPHMNAFGGEDRFWLGPESGRFALLFAPGAEIQFADWFAPAVLTPCRSRWSASPGSRRALPPGLP
jgi:hypothetical protein